MPVLRPVVAVALCLGLVIGGAPARAEEPIDAIVAVVDSDVVMQSELDRQLERVRAELAQRGAPVPPRGVLEQQVLERLVLQKIQLARARRAQISVDDDELNAAISRIAAQNGLDMAQFRTILEQDGFDFRRFREDMRNELTIAKLQREEVVNRVRVTPREVEDELANMMQQGEIAQEFHLRHILIALPPDASPEQRAAARKRAEGIVARAREGADFAALARAESDAPTADAGGDLGWRANRDLPTLFAPVVRQMKPGEVSDPLETEGGIHIVQLAERRMSGKARHVVRQTHVEHILIRPNELVSDADAVRRLRQLRDRIEAGESFEELARAHSDDTATAVKGGDVGWVSPGTLVPEFEQAMNELKPGELSEPVRTHFGWHLIRVLARRDYDGTEEVLKAEARKRVHERKVAEALERWNRRLRDEAYVEYRLPSLDARVAEH